jgi:hypothetical protein
VPIGPSGISFVAIAPRSHRNVELHPVVDLIRLRAADVPGDARTADHRPGEPPSDRVFLADDADVDVALLEDTVVRDQADRILEQANPIVEEVADLGQHLGRNVLVDPADPEVIGMHPGT